MASETILDIQNISKQFPGTLALDDVSFKIKSGEVHAICGENGAGKSTLMHILAGNYPPDNGRIIFDGREIENIDQREIQDMGISIVYQERSLVSTLTVAENIFPDRQFKTKLGFIDRKKTNEKAKDILRTLKVNVRPDRMLSTLPPAVQQMIEIAKALSLESKVLILDEPTATITKTETEVLFDVIKDLKKKGLTVIYISHRLAEIFSIADRVSVLKDGRYICTKEVGETNVDEIVMNMVGRNLLNVEQESCRDKDRIMFSVENLNSEKFSNIHFQVKAGEILTLTGLSGAGRTEIALALFGADPKATGRVRLDGKEIKFRSVKEAMHAGIGYMPEDRKEQGLFLEMSIQENIVSANLELFSQNGVFNKKAAQKAAREYKKKLNIIARDVNKEVLLLSGGNQQKVVIAKWLLVNPKLLIVDEPTRGVDVGAKEEIYELLHAFVESGKSLLVISSDMTEVLSISDRIIILSEGEITGEMVRGEFSEEKILKYASGLLRNK